MHQISFGNVLKEARLAKGWDLASVSRELRIRQDIIVAIENSDFQRMPSRGYARNMIIAYARLLGLNAQDVSRMYLDQEYAYQVEQAHQSVGDSIRMHSDPYSRGSASDTSSFKKVRSSRSTRSQQPERQSQRGRASESSLYDGRSNGLGRAVYSQNADVYSASNPQVAHRARRSAMPEGKYFNMYSAPRNIPNPNRNRNIIIGVVVALLIVIILAVAMMMSHNTEPQTNIPVTGAESTQADTSTADGSNSTENSGDSSTASTEETETAPTEFTLKYTVDSGSTSYIEVYVDGETKESDDVTGATEKTYTSSDNIRFVSSETSGVHVYINDKEQKLKSNGSGIVNTTYKFSDILNDWYDEHPNAKKSSSSSSSSSKSSSDSKSSSSSDSSSSSSSSETSSSSE